MSVLKKTQALVSLKQRNSVLEVQSKLFYNNRNITLKIKSFVLHTRENLEKVFFIK